MFYFRLLFGVFLLNFLISGTVLGQGIDSDETCFGSQAIENNSVTPMTLTLPECIAQGLKKNPEIKAADYEIKKAVSEIGSQRGNFFPTLTMNTFGQEIQSINSEGLTDKDYVDQDIYVFDLRLSQTLFQGFTILNSYQKSILSRESSQYRKEQAEMELILDIQTDFLKLFKAKEDVRSLQSAVERLEVNVKSANAFFEKEMAPYLSVLQAKVDLADAQQKLSQAENEVETQKVVLNISLGIPVETPVRYKGRFNFEAMDSDLKLIDCLSCAYGNRPEMKIAEKSLQMAKKDKAIQMGRLSPKITASADYIYRKNNYDVPGTSIIGELYDRDQQNTYWTAMIQLQWDFNLGGQQFYQHTKATYEIDRLMQQRKFIKDRITAHVRMSFLKLQEARTRIDLTRTALQAAEESYDRAKKRSQVRVGTVSELLDIQDRLTRAETNCNQAIADFQLGIANLSYTMGLRNVALTNVKNFTPPTMDGRDIH